MLIPLLTFFLRQRVLILIFTAGLSTGGLYAFKTIPIVTFPIELQLRGAPGRTDIRSFLKVGASIITGVFRDDIDIYLARQIVLKRVLEGQDLLPPGATSQLVPNYTSLGEVYQFYLDGRVDGDRHGGGHTGL